MLIILCLLSGAGFSLGICLGADAFLSLSWLYLLPLGFVGGAVLFAVLAAVFLFVACGVVDMKKLPDKDSKFYRTMTYLYVDAIKTALGLKIETEGLEKTPVGTRFLLVCNHISDLDPVVLFYCFYKSTLAFISKRENDQKPLVGQIQRKILCQPINRENDREALKTILRCIQLIKEDQVAIGVFPEGYTSLDGKLRHFRNGVFKIAQKANVPVVVCTVQGTQAAMKSLFKLKGGYVKLHLVDVISAEEAKAMNTAELGERVYEMMAKDLGPENVYDSGENP
ncbi:MAG: 1-acyl-sn-glycerol-3-phosphate acyltransferase [Oscillospiraceae bacterium]|nr:1-acyl-sn-glycerol-3-phosphate acyltransferase [Oscillospiraceae bacterium]